MLRKFLVKDIKLYHTTLYKKFVPKKLSNNAVDNFRPLTDRDSTNNRTGPILRNGAIKSNNLNQIGISHT